MARGYGKGGLVSPGSGEICTVPGAQCSSFSFDPNVSSTVGGSSCMVRLGFIALWLTKDIILFFFVWQAYAGTE
jgi:hypothetical protein